ncbi:Uncharacterized protein FWK35_00009403 [Aphis craccivora]|uniref:Uncharacterized protein n=1 Tax=Aphis craccivora TaxID=307492 RepID=A0A6G0YWC2_APHCR|nr:Uncharacterized protein FWK35_00009403 [Aphis craccivora]
MCKFKNFTILSNLCCHRPLRQLLHRQIQLLQLSLPADKNTIAVPFSTRFTFNKHYYGTWYCWYSDTKSFILDSASVNSISSIPSPVYQCKNALRRNMAVNCSEIRLNISWMAVVLPINVADILRPRGGISHTATLTLLGIHSTKYLNKFIIHD